jgi:hypothetical protein
MSHHPGEAKRIADWIATRLNEMLAGDAVQWS